MPVRLLHTSDWHVGKGILRTPRDEDHRAALAEIRDLAASHDVDAVVICGDVFEQANPSADAAKIVFDGLLSLREAADTVIVVAGNHDSPKRWGSVRGLFEIANVHIMTRVVHPDEGGRVVVSGADGTECELVAVPWVYERQLTGTADLLGMAGDTYRSYADGMARIIEFLCGAIEDRSRPGVLAGHIFVHGSAISPEKRTLTSGDVYAVPASVFPESLHYVALGHVHRPQKVATTMIAAHYSGSPLQLDFGEAGEQKSVRLVELEPKSPAVVRELPLASGRPVRRLEGTLEELEDQYQRLDQDCWLAVTVRCQRAEPGLADRAREVCPAAIAVYLDPQERPGSRRRSGPTLQGLSPRELFRRYLTERQGRAEPEDADLDLFEEVLLDAERGDELPAEPVSTSSVVASAPETDGAKAEPEEVIP